VGEVIRKVKGGRFLGYYLRWYEGGRRRQKASGCATHLEAKRMLLEIEARAARGEAGFSAPKQPDSLTVGEVCERFLGEFNSPRIKHIGRYRSGSRASLRPLLAAIGSVPLAKLTRKQLEQTRDKLSQRYRANTVRNILRPLGAALSWAVRQDLAPHSPMRGLELPRKERSLESLTQREAALLLVEAERQARKGGLPWWSRWVAISLALRLGIRRGEVFGLRWTDIDFAAKRITVARSYRLTPKSGKARHLPLPSSLVPLLEEWRGRCPETAERLICPVVHRGRWQMSSEKATHCLRLLLKTAGCRTLTRGWHALRHTFASQYLMAGGSIAALQQMLGHASVETTMIYAHLSSDYLAGEIERLKY
jgi:integrase